MTGNAVQLHNSKPYQVILNIPYSFYYIHKLYLTIQVLIIKTLVEAKLFFQLTMQQP